MVKLLKTRSYVVVIQVYLKLLFNQVKLLLWFINYKNTGYFYLLFAFISLLVEMVKVYIPDK